MAGHRKVVIAAFDRVGLLDITGPAEVFSAATQLLGRKSGYEVVVAARDRGPVRTGSGVQLIADAGWDEVTGEIDTIIIPGGLAFAPNGVEPKAVPELAAWVADRAPSCRRIASVCAGAHILAAAGLLDGQRATTHWFSADRLAADHPEVEVDADPIFIRSGRIWTSAGVTSGIDLALAMVAADHHEALARETARWLVMYLRRPGGQSQFSVPLSTPEPRSEKIRQVQIWLADNLTADLSVAALARRAHMSERHFARVFIEQTAVTPAAFVEASRTEAARRLLEQSDIPLDAVATRCGFGSVETLYRTFRRRLGATPNEYRRRFRLHPQEQIRCT